MSTQTEHLKLDLREASDIFNPLSTNSNFETLDTVIYEIQQKGGVPTYTTTASANLLKLSANPTPNETVFKFVAAGDANTWSYQETVNNIIALDGTQKTVKAGEMYVAWVNSANAMVVIAWPDVVNAQTFDGKSPSEWATTAQLQAVNTTATNATQTAQAAATVANNALEVAQKAGLTLTKLWELDGTPVFSAFNININFSAGDVLLVVYVDSNAYGEEKLLFTKITLGKRLYLTGFSDYEFANFYFTCRRLDFNSTGTAISVSQSYHNQAFADNPTASSNNDNIAIKAIYKVTGLDI